MAENYIKIHGLRGWTWESIIKGIIIEHIKSVESQSDKEIEAHHIEILWHSFIQVAGVENLKSVPNTTDPEHFHVKTILFIYSLECFLFKKLNKASRDKDQSVIQTLGPYAVAISKIID